KASATHYARGATPIGRPLLSTRLEGIQIGDIVEMDRPGRWSVSPASGPTNQLPDVTGTRRRRLLGQARPPTPDQRVARALAAPARGRHDHTRLASNLRRSVQANPQVRRSAA